MFGKPKTEKLSYGIVGLGRFSSALATELAASGADLLVIDHDEEKVRELRELTDNALVVHSLDKKTLSETGIQNCDVAVVCIGEHIEPSILTTLNLVDLGSRRSLPRPPAPSTARSCAAWAPRWSTPSGTWPSGWPSGWRAPGCWTSSS